MTMTTTTRWASVVYIDGDEAEQVLTLIYSATDPYTGERVGMGPNSDGVADAVDYLCQWDYGPESEHTTYDREPWGCWDDTAEHNGYTLAWNNGLGYVSLQRPAS
jgi:hypothetical protein